MYRAECFGFKARPYKLRTGARDEESPIRQALKSFTFHTGLRPCPQCVAAEFDKDVSPVEERETAPLGSAKNQARCALFTVELANHHICEARAVAVGVNDSDILPDDVVVVLNVSVEIARLW